MYKIKNKKRLGILLTYICIIALMIHFSNFAEPQVIINCSIKPRTQDSYKEINLILNVEIIEPLFVISHRNLEADDLRDVLIDNERVSYLRGSKVIQNNKSELKARYKQEVYFLLEEITINEIASLFDNTKIKVSWYTPFKGLEERTYYLKDYLREVN